MYTREEFHEGDTGIPVFVRIKDDVHRRQIGEDLMYRTDEATGKRYFDIDESIHRNDEFIISVLIADGVIKDNNPIHLPTGLVYREYAEPFDVFGRNKNKED